MSSRTLILVLSGFIVSSCAWTPHNVPVTAKAPIVPSEVGKGTIVALQVIDDRGSLVVGQRGVGMQGADITVSGIIPTLEQELKTGLESKGFTVVSDETDADVEFEARLRSFSFFIETGFWTGGENTSVAISVEAEKGSVDFDRTYRSSDEERIMVVPSGDSITKK